MWIRFRRWLFERLEALDKWVSDFLDDHFKCEVCMEEQADYTCVGCGRRICGTCDSNYYADEVLCTKCQAEMTPEEIDRDRREHANALKQDCRCDSGEHCELVQAEHDFIAKWATKEATE